MSLFILIFGCNQDNLKKYNFQTYDLQRRDLSITVSSTGTLTADGAVEIGSQVSGTISQVLVDFNDIVKEGQIIARLKTDLLDASKKEAEANLMRAKAQYEQAEAEFTQNKQLFEKGFLSSKEFLPIKTAFETSKATQQSALISLDRAQTNIGYATIRSPINGIILERNIEAGQTIAASLSSPTLFVIAKDLSRMKIAALVDETDISKVAQGQKVSFTVSAFPELTFTGNVIQIRRKPVTAQNVVNYTVIIEALNDENRLLPGMTTTIEFIVSQEKNVLVVPNEALNFMPPSDLIPKDAQKSDKRNYTSTPESGRLPGKQSTDKISTKRQRPSILWIVNDSNQITPVRVKTGLNDGSKTIVSADELKEGMQIITSTFTKDKKKSKTSATNQRNSRMMPRPMF
jgi:HlyD family secretion protein